MRKTILVVCMFLINISCLVYASPLKTSPLATHTHKYKIETQIVQFSDKWWDFGMWLFKRANGKWKQVEEITEPDKDGQQYNIAAYVFYASPTKKEAKEGIREKAKEWEKTLMKKPCSYEIIWEN